MAHPVSFLHDKYPNITWILRAERQLSLDGATTVASNRELHTATCAITGIDLPDTCKGVAYSKKEAKYNAAVAIIEHLNLRCEWGGGDQVHADDTIDMVKSGIAELSTPSVTSLVQYCAREHIQCTFSVQTENGDDRPRFSCTVMLKSASGEPTTFSGSGRNKRDAKLVACQEAWHFLMSNKCDDTLARVTKRARVGDGDGDVPLNDIDTPHSVDALLMRRSDVVLPNHMKQEVAVFCNSVALASQSLYHHVSGNTGLPVCGKQVLATITCHDTVHHNMRIISLATGTRCIKAKNVTINGSVIHDSHAEVMARRGFIRFLYGQILKYIMHTMSILGGDGGDDVESCIVEFSDVALATAVRQADINTIVARLSVIDGKIKIKIKDHIVFHLYVSMAPCGDSSVFARNSIEPALTPDVDSDAQHAAYDRCTSDQLEWITSSELIHRCQCDNPMDCISDVQRKHRKQSSLRAKVEGGQGSIPVTDNQLQTLTDLMTGTRIWTMSCSDKILKWNYCGIQGALCGTLLDRPCYLSCIIIGDLFHPVHSTRALCCRWGSSAHVMKTSGHYHVHHPIVCSATQGPHDYNSGEPCRAVLVTNDTSSLDVSTNSSTNWVLDGDCVVENTDALTGVSVNGSVSRLAKTSLYRMYDAVQTAMRDLLSVIDGKQRVNDSLTYHDAKHANTEYYRCLDSFKQQCERNAWGRWLCKPHEITDFTL